MTESDNCSMEHWKLFFDKILPIAPMPELGRGIPPSKSVTIYGKPQSPLLVLDSYFDLVEPPEPIWRSNLDAMLREVKKKYTFQNRSLMETKVLSLLLQGRLDYLHGYFTRTGLHSVQQVEISWVEIPTRFYLPLLIAPFPLSYVGRLTVRHQEGQDKRYGWLITWVYQYSTSRVSPKKKSLTLSKTSSEDEIYSQPPKLGEVFDFSN